MSATTVNGIDLAELAKDLVLVDSDANITARKIFQTLNTNRLTTTQVQCDSVGPDIAHTAAEAIRLDHNETVLGNLRFEILRVQGDVHLSSLNGEPFPAGYITLDGDQKVDSNLIADRIAMLGDIRLKKGALVNGVDIHEAYANTWMVICILSSLFFFLIYC